jgi:exopolyphosphatase/guanosine-5'-triphosphate,3'-diphosphate pyrophosphatase
MKWRNLDDTQINDFFLNNKEKASSGVLVKLSKIKKEEDKKVFAAIDLGTNCCRLVLANPTPSSFKVIETYSKVTRLGQGIIQKNELSRQAVDRTISALKICSEILSEFEPIQQHRFVATAACRRAKNCDEFLARVKKETGVELEIISPKEEARLAVAGCMPLVNRSITKTLVFDIGGGSTEISWATITPHGKTNVEGYVSIPYGVVTIAEAFPGDDMTSLAYDAVVDKTMKLLLEFEEKYNIYEHMKNQEVQVIGTSGTVTVLGALHLNLSKYNRSVVDGLTLTIEDIEKVIRKIKRIGNEGRIKHSCIGKSKADLTIAGCAVVEAITKIWPILEITVADRGIREGILLDMIHKQHNKEKSKKKHKFGKKFKNHKNK